MRIIFLDESGYTPGEWNSDKNLSAQPFHVLSAVSFPSEVLPDLYRNIRSLVEKLGVEGIEGRRLGRGHEIKAKDVAGAKGYWKENQENRDYIRYLMVDCVRLFDGTAFVSIIDKPKLNENYASPDDPSDRAVLHMYERIERHLEELDDYAICIFDQNKMAEDDLQNNLMAYGADGSQLHYYSKAYDRPVIKQQNFEHILDHVSGRSDASIGLQIADFYANLTYVYHRDGAPQEYDWWWILHNSLMSDHNSITEGYGYKKFP